MVEQTKDTVGINDDIGQEMVDKQREQILRDIENHEEKLEELKSTKQRHARQLARDRELFEIRLKDVRRIVPTFKYEESDRYWELVHDTLKEEAEYNLFLGEGKQKGFEKQIEQIENAVSQMKEDLKKLEEE